MLRGHLLAHRLAYRLAHHLAHHLGPHRLATPTPPTAAFAVSHTSNGRLTLFCSHIARS